MMCVTFSSEPSAFGYALLHSPFLCRFKYGDPLRDGSTAIWKELLALTSCGRKELLKPGQIIPELLDEKLKTSSVFFKP